MNLLSKIGASIGLASALMSGYLMLIIIPMAQTAKSKLKTLIESEDGWASPEYRELMEIERLQIEWGQYVLLVGGIAILLSLYPAIKKSKMGLFGITLGIISFFIGAAYGTHMFS